MINHIIASGCSFTADGIGGVPPSKLHPDGGCSYVDDASYEKIFPKSWVGHVAKKLNVKSLVNLASNSHGNISIANNIISLLNFYSYDPANTIILFNISDPARLDLPCSWDHPDKSEYCCWSNDILPYTYMKKNSKPVEIASKNIGIEQIELLSTNSILGMMSYLKQNKFNFKFLLMSNYLDHPLLGPVINQFRSNMIELDSQVGMKEFAQSLNLTAEDKSHPNNQCHIKIAELVLEKII